MGLGDFGLPYASYDMGRAGGVLALLISMFVVGVCVWLAARAVLRKDDFHQALAAGMVGVLAAQFAYVVADEYTIVGFFLALAAFSLVAAGFYRAKPAQGFVVGAVAWVLWIVASISLGYVQQHWH